MKKVVITLAGKNEQEMASVITASVRKFLTELGYTNTLVEQENCKPQKELKVMGFMTKTI